jgi:chromosome segregation ATPase
VFGSKTRTIDDQAAEITRLQQQLDSTREELDTERSLRQRLTQRIDGLLSVSSQLKEQRTNARSVAERTNGLIRDHVCPRVPGDAARVAEENARLRTQIVALNERLLLLQAANIGAYRKLAEERGVTAAESSAA